MAALTIVGRMTSLCHPIKPNAGNGRVLYPQGGFAKSHLYQRNVTVVFVALSLNNFGFRDRCQYRPTYFRYFVTGLYSELLYVRKTDFNRENVDGYAIMEHKDAKLTHV